MQIALEALIGGTARTITEAASVAGLTREALSKAIQKPWVRDRMSTLIQQSLGTTAMKAAHQMDMLLASDNGMVSFNAARFALATGANIQPPVRASTNISINTGIGYLINLDEPGAGVVIDGTAEEVKDVAER